MNIKIFKNRWLAWTVAIILFIGIVLVGYIQYINLQFEIDMAEDQNTFVYCEVFDPTVEK